MNRRKRAIVALSALCAFLAAIAIAGALMDPAKYGHDFGAKNLPPSLAHPFGTDHLGRDMFSRTLKGLSSSILLGTVAASFSALLALFLGTFAGMAGGKVDAAISWLVDLFMGVPHMVLLMMISAALGKGLAGVAIAVALTHWPNLTRVIRGEVIDVKNSQHVKAAFRLGLGFWKVAAKEIIPCVLSQFLVGMILLFPHAILHEASLTFLGFGLPIDAPAIGVMLSQSLKYIATGKWWLMFFPGACLVCVVMSFERLAHNLGAMVSPATAQE